MIYGHVYMYMDYIYDASYVYWDASMSGWIIFFELNVYLSSFVVTGLGRSGHSDRLSHTSSPTSLIVVDVADVGIHAIQLPNVGKVSI
jgi:hypothetical protein